jgi:glycosyltransferase involved in cell wall biosynthesis/glutathione synthase/RimK-type ligase-like ATP-grasp enzyme
MRRLAIHHRDNSYSDRWIAYCELHGIPYKVVNCLDSDIIEQLASSDALLWNWDHGDPREQLMARHVIMAAEAMGVTVFPSTSTCWHFDDKIAQKYLLEAIGAPLVRTYVFYSLKEALHWIDRASFPKVFKLRKGAGSSNVKLVQSFREARALTRRAFSAGFSPIPHYGQDALKRYRAAHRRGDLLNVVRRIPQVWARIRQNNKMMGREKGYVYFQDFIPYNGFDTRVTVIGERAFAFTRNVRPGDFRASGSGDIVYDSNRIQQKCVEIAFDVTRKVGSQSMAFDFVSGENQQPLILEVSYCYNAKAVYACPGHWDAKLNWHQGHIWPQDAILIDLLNDVYPSKQYRIQPETIPPLVSNGPRTLSSMIPPNNASSRFLTIGPSSIEQHCRSTKRLRSWFRETMRAVTSLQESRNSADISPSKEVPDKTCRILYLVGQLGLGGLERQLVYLIRSMDRGRYKPVVALWSNSPDDYYARDLRALDVPVVRLGENPTRSAKLRALCSLVYAVRPEVIHSYTFYTNIAAWWAARGTGAIPIGSVRSNFILDHQQTGKVFGRLCGRLPSAQIFNSLTAEQNARQTTTLFRSRRIYVIKNGVDLDRFSPRSHPAGGYILAVGSMYPVKRWDRLIRAAALLASKGLCPEVVHVGSGPLQEELQAMTRNLHVEHLFRFLGARDDIADLLADAAFLVHTAENEGCPNVIMEAMASGRAVVATGAGDIPYLIEEGKTGFVVPKEDEALLADRIATLLEDRELCRRMGDAGRAKAEQAFGLDRLRSETFEAYRAEGWRDA